MQLLIPKVSCNLAKLDFLNQSLASRRVLEALKCKSEAEFELSLKKRLYLMVQTMFDDMFERKMTSSFSFMVFNDYRWLLIIIDYH